MISGGKGGYSTGLVELTIGDILYIYTGGKGSSAAGNLSAAGGFNGGGNISANVGSSNSYKALRGAGGGGTDIRINSTSIYSRVIVAGRWWTELVEAEMKIHI